MPGAFESAKTGTTVPTCCMKRDQSAPCAVSKPNSLGKVDARCIEKSPEQRNETRRMALEQVQAARKEQGRWQRQAWLGQDTVERVADVLRRNQLQRRVLCMAQCKCPNITPISPEYKPNITPM